MPLLIEAKHFAACPFVALSLLVLCKAILRISRLFLCSTAQRNAVPLHCRQSRASPLPRCSKLCNAFADRQDSLPGAALPSHCLTLLFLCHATPRRCFSSLCLASRFLCSSSPINSFAGRFTAMMFRCVSNQIPAVPILCRSTPGYALPLLCCPAHCLAILCFALARLFRRLRPRGSGPCRSCATGPGPGNIRSPATRVPVSGPFHPCR